MRQAVAVAPEVNASGATRVSGEWRLSAVEFDVLWREAGHGEPPYPLDVPSPGTTYQERAELVAAVHAGLAARDTGGLDGALAVLAAGEVLIDGHLVLDDHIRLVAARVGEQAAMALQFEDRLIVRAMTGPRLAAALTELLPTVPAAHGQSVSVPYRALTAALAGLGEGASVHDFGQALRDAGVRGADVRWLANLVTANQSNAAQLGVTLRRPGGGEHRIGFLSWFATEHGGVIIHRPHGGDWATVAPGDPARLVARLMDLARSTGEPHTV